MKTLSSEQLEKLTGGICYDFQRTPIHECANLCLFGSIDTFNIQGLVSYVTGDVVCIL